MLSIIIVNYKNPPLLRLCLKSLAKTLSPSFKYEILVVDVASTIETRGIVSEFPEVRLLSFKDNIGYTRGVNEGIKNSDGEAFLILNSDIIPLDNSIEKMYGYLMENQDVGMVGPQLLNFDGSIQDSSFRFYGPMTVVYRRTFLGNLPWAKKELDRFLAKDMNRNEILSVDWIMGSAIMADKKAFQKIGFMDEKLFLYMSEVDWAKRFWENGYKVKYFPRSQMYHYHRRGSKGKFNAFDIINKETRWHIIDAIRYFRKHGISARLAKASGGARAKSFSA
ncbi:MAG: glycosyltransferase family 2 protein [Candidatus Yanofskybacteria bacterium]|nr:glycosyltransferase family 2 protein [Candidatus Yanofskybacteria bacterium]